MVKFEQVIFRMTIVHINHKSLYTYNETSTQIFAIRTGMGARGSVEGDVDVSGFTGGGGGGQTWVRITWELDKEVGRARRAAKIDQSKIAKKTTRGLI